MVFKIKYDPASNVRFVKCVEKYPIIYKYRHLSAKRPDKIAAAWEIIAKELDSTAFYCRDRWTNLMGSYKRYLRHKAENTMKKEYYLAKHMEFVRPYLNIKKGKSTNHNSEPSGEDSLADIEMSESSVKMEECNDFPIKPLCIVVDSSEDEETIFSPDIASSEGPMIISRHNRSGEYGESSSDEDENPDFCFLKSLLPDIRLMTPQQKIRFRKELLNAVDMTLYGEDLKNVIFITQDVES